MRSSRILAIALSLVTLPLLAQSNDIGVWAAGSRVGSTNAFGSNAKFDSGDGFAVSWNHYWTAHLSTEFAGADLRNDGRLESAGATVLNLDRLKMKTVTGTVQWHFAPPALLDPFVGVGAAYIKADDLKSADLTAAGIGTVPIEKKWGLVANAGLDANITHNFGVGVDVKYIPYEPSSGSVAASALKLKLNPVIVAVGARFRF